MSAIAAAFARCKAEKRAAFIPYITAGDPDLATTRRLVAALARAGADVIELGVPFSDPIADGPVNQRAASRALAAGTTLSGILRLVAETRESAGVPIVLFTYFNPVHRRGVRAFAEEAADAGVDGVLCVDLPPEEAGELAAALAREAVDRVFLLSPTSGRERVRLAAEIASGFLYYVSRTGVTGVRETLPADLAEELKRVRKGSRLPVAVGFGISTPEQAARVAELADGVVVGSALVRLVEEHAGDLAALEEAVESTARALAAALSRPRRRWFG